MSQLFKTSTERKLRWALFALLVISSFIAVGLLIYRNTMSDSREYLFMVRNLYLAWIPFIMSLVAYSARRLSKVLRITVTLFCAILWLLFLPNAPYLLTDFQHLTRNNDAPLWYDVIMLLWFGWIGMLLGIFSLYYMHEIVMRSFGKFIGWIFAIGVILLNSFGVYLGRFLRWNSRDLLFRPMVVIEDTLNNLSHPGNHQTIILYTGFLALLFLVIYGTFYIFGNLVSERRADSG